MNELHRQKQQEKQLARIRRLIIAGLDSENVLALHVTLIGIATELGIVIYQDERKEEETA